MTEETFHCEYCQQRKPVAEAYHSYCCKACHDYDGGDDPDYDRPSAQERAEMDYRAKYYGR